MYGYVPGLPELFFSATPSDARGVLGLSQNDEVQFDKVTATSFHGDGSGLTGLPDSGGVDESSDYVWTGSHLFGNPIALRSQNESQSLSLIHI